MGLIDLINSIQTDLVVVLGVIYIAWQMYKARK